jgi:heterodisulfide reductase subunit B
MCHANLDARQKRQAGPDGRGRQMPIFYISELLGLAMGLPGARRWWKRHLTDPRPLLRTKGLA